MNQIAANIKAYRKLRKLSQRDLAKKIDGGLNTIIRYESGNSDFSINTLVKIAKVLDITIYNLFGADYIFNGANTFTVEQLEDYKHTLRLERIKKYPEKLLNDLLDLNKKFEAE